MARFVVRVQLNGKVPESTYVLLDHAMEGRGLTSRIRGGDGVLYQLPPGEYVGQGDMTMDQALSYVQQGVEQVWKSYELLVTEGPSAFLLRPA